MLIIHGDNQVASRNFLMSVKMDAVSLDGENLTLADLQQHAGSTNLFGETNDVIVEGFFSRRPSNDKKKIVEYLEKNQVDAIFWDGKDLGMQLKNFQANVVKKFDLSKTIFKFLDSFSIADLQQTLENTPVELVFSLLAGHVRKMLMVKEAAGNMPAWQISKLKSQASKYNELRTMHYELLMIDFKNKTSASSMDLSSALELWVAKHSL